MKRLILAVLTAGILVNASAFPAPIVLPGGPLFLEGLTAEQYSQNNDINNVANPARAGVPEGNWGVMEITTVSVGAALSPAGSDIAGPGPMIFSNGQNGGQQILGIFYRIINNPGGPPTTSRGGVLDLYFWDNNNQTLNTSFSSTDLLKRGQGGSQSGNIEGAYLGFTCPPNTSGCTFLARFDLTPGADVNSQANTIITPTGSSTFDSYLSVDTTTVGAWTSSLNSNFFTLNPINQTCGAVGVSCTSTNDMRSGGTYTRIGAEGWDVANTDIIGLGKNISSRAFAVPEPNSLALLSIGIAVAAAFGVRRRAKAQASRWMGQQRQSLTLRSSASAPRGDLVFSGFVVA